MDKKLINRAIKKLELRDIKLHESLFSRPSDTDPSLYPTSIRKELSTSINAEELTFIDEDSADKGSEELIILRIYIASTLKCFDNKPDSQLGDVDEKALFTISATYKVDYEIIEELGDDEREAFSRFNAVHNAWPFWRQHIAYIVNNASLPNITVPLFRDTGVSKKGKANKR